MFSLACDMGLFGNHRYDSLLETFMEKSPWVHLALERSLSLQAPPYPNSPSFPFGLRDFAWLQP